ncbi:M3 family metallopeptidase [Fusibacter sp. JL216-2]|uniref:M3 family metallopeptidase n=1 Tax=Fusibacter sp. JL216-2 TaxID=3071453 RepID=UPI003D347BCC
MKDQKDFFNEGQVEESQTKVRQMIDSPFEDELIEPKKSKRFRKGCAGFLIVLMLAFVSLMAIGYYLEGDTSTDKEAFAEYSPDLRMDLTDLFNSDDKWHDGMERLETLVNDLENQKETMGESKEAFRRALRLRENIYKLMDKLEIYAGLRSDTNTDDDAAADMVALYSSKASSVNERLSFVDEKATDIKKQDLESWANDPEFSSYKNDLDYWIEYYDYGFDADYEALVSGSLRMGEVPEEIYDAFHYQTDFEEEDPYYYDLWSENGEKRKENYLALYEKIRIGSEILASALEGEVLYNNYMAKLSDYEGPLEQALKSDGLEKEDFETYVAEVKKGLVLLHRWKGLEKDLRGLEKNERLHRYDMYLSFVDEKYELNGEMKYRSATDVLRKGLGPLGKEYRSIYDDILASFHIDTQPRDNKIDGAYTWGTYETRPYLLVNYYGDFEDMLTIGHEMGHAVHHELSRSTQNYGDYDASILIAEMAATTNEALMFEWILSNDETFDAQEREAVLIEYAQSIEETIYDQLLAAEFQMRIHEDAKKGINLDAQYLSDVYIELTQEYYGPSYEAGEADALVWAEIPHLYWGFYVQNYAIGYTTGLVNASRLISEPGFQDKYNDLLRQGGSKTAGQQLESLGYGKSGQLAVAQMLDRFEWILDELTLTFDQ